MAVVAVLAGVALWLCCRVAWWWWPYHARVVVAAGLAGVAWHGGGGHVGVTWHGSGGHVVVMAWWPQVWQGSHGIAVVVALWSCGGGSGSGGGRVAWQSWPCRGRVVVVAVVMGVVSWMCCRMAWRLWPRHGCITTLSHPVVVVVVIVVVMWWWWWWWWTHHRIASHGRGHIVVILLLRSWSWLCTGCARVMVVNKMNKNSNGVNTYLWITQVGPQLPVDGHQYSTEEGSNIPSCPY
jgi:hypothetical protein